MHIFHHALRYLAVEHKESFATEFIDENHIRVVMFSYDKEPEIHLTINDYGVLHAHVQIGNCKHLVTRHFESLGAIEIIDRSISTLMRYLVKHQRMDNTIIGMIDRLRDEL